MSTDQVKKRESSNNGVTLNITKQLSTSKHTQTLFETTASHQLGDQAYSNNSLIAPP